MSNVASPELSRELFELSGWECERNYCTSSSCTLMGWYDNGKYICPKYSAGYLLRKLPHEIVEKPVPTTYEHYSLRLGAETSGEWYANYWMFDSPLISLDDIEPYNTPEDALAKLAIELHKAGILPISGRD